MNNSFKDRDGWIWLDGSFIKWRDANTHVISQGLHYASAVFEGERAYNGKIFKSKEHTERLFKSAEITIDIRYELNCCFLIDVVKIINQSVKKFKALKVPKSVCPGF